MARRRRNLAIKLYDENPTIAFQVCSRDALIRYSKKFNKILEIGPFCNPLVEGQNVSYLDVLNKSALEDAAKALGLSAVPMVFVNSRWVPRTMRDEENVVLSILAELGAR